MTVLLRHTPSGYFYGGPSLWVSEPEQAADLKTIEHASETSRREQVSDTEIVTAPEIQKCDWVQMLQQWQEAESRGRAA